MDISYQRAKNLDSQESQSFSEGTTGFLERRCPSVQIMSSKLVLISSKECSSSSMRVELTSEIEGKQGKKKKKKNLAFPLSRLPPEGTSHLCPHLGWVFQLQGIWSRKSFTKVYNSFPVVNSRSGQISHQEEPFQPDWVWKQLARCTLPFPRGHHLWAQHRGCTTRSVSILYQSRNRKGNADASSQHPPPCLRSFPPSPITFLWLF